jgi:hypothetical protein
MRSKRLESRENGDRSMAAGRVRGCLFALTFVGLCLSASVSSSAARDTIRNVAYVEAVSGRVLASAAGSPSLLDVLDIIGEGTRLDLPANAELRICHYRLGKLVTLKGPVRASISAAGVTVEHGKAPSTAGEGCAEPVVSTLQGGLMTRNIALTATKVPLRPSIRVVNRGTKAIRRIALWDGKQQMLLATFDRKAARPVLDEGRSYLLVIEQSDGRELRMMLEASAETRTGPVIFVVP